MFGSISNTRWQVKNKNWQFSMKKCPKFSKLKKKGRMTRDFALRLQSYSSKVVLTRCCKNFWIYNFPDEKKTKAQLQLYSKPTGEDFYVKRNFEESLLSFLSLFKLRSNRTPLSEHKSCERVPFKYRKQFHRIAVVHIVFS